MSQSVAGHAAAGSITNESLCSAGQLVAAKAYNRDK